MLSPQGLEMINSLGGGGGGGMVVASMYPLWTLFISFKSFGVDAIATIPHGDSMLRYIHFDLLFWIDFLCATNYGIHQINKLRLWVAINDLFAFNYDARPND